MQNDIKSDLKDLRAFFSMSKTWTHPTSLKYMTEDKKQFDLDKIAKEFNEALKFISEISEKKGTLLFLTSRKESVDLLKQCAEDLSMFYVVDRWIGGTFSNFNNISSRVRLMKEYKKAATQKTWNEKYTKKETLLLERQLDRLKIKFGGIENLEQLPSAIVILDPSKDEIAVKEAMAKGVKIIAITNSNSNLDNFDYKILVNIGSIKVVRYIFEKIKEAYKSK